MAVPAAACATGQRGGTEDAAAATADDVYVRVFPQLGHTSNVISAAYSPDGRRIVSASLDGTVGVCEILAKFIKKL
jgi:WD40 repeat protein